MEKAIYFAQISHALSRPPTAPTEARLVTAPAPTREDAARHRPGAVGTADGNAAAVVVADAEGRTAMPKHCAEIGASASAATAPTAISSTVANPALRLRKTRVAEETELAKGEGVAADALRWLGVTSPAELQHVSACILPTPSVA